MLEAVSQDGQHAVCIDSGLEGAREFFRRAALRLEALPRFRLRALHKADECIKEQRIFRVVGVAVDGVAAREHRGVNVGFKLFFGGVQGYDTSLHYWNRIYILIICKYGR